MNENNSGNMGHNNRVRGIAIYLFLISGIGLGAIFAYLRGVESWLDAKLFLVSFGAIGAVVGSIVLKCIGRFRTSNSKLHTDASHQ